MFHPHDLHVEELGFESNSPKPIFLLEQILSFRTLYVCVSAPYPHTNERLCSRDFTNAFWLGNRKSDVDPTARV